MQQVCWLPALPVFNQFCRHACLGEPGTDADGDQHILGFTGHGSPVVLLQKCQRLGAFAVTLHLIFLRVRVSD